MGNSRTVIHELGAGEIAQAVKNRVLSPVEVLEAYLKRIKALDVKVQAWSLVDWDGARRQAMELEAEAAKGSLRGPLHGVPIGVKDEFHVRGLPTGMRDWSELPVEPEDATCVARLRSAGAIIVGKTHMPINGRLPPTRNPWNLEHTAGGTSSGSGAAVGARMVPLALGEQTVGSNLRPAAYCGVDAIKPTYGRVSRFGCFPFIWSLDHVGLIGLNMEDLALALSVIAGPDPRDATALQLPAPPAELDVKSFGSPHIGVIRNFFPERTEPLMQAALDGAARRFGDEGATLSDFNLPDEFELAWTIRPLLDVEMNLFHTYDQAISPKAPAYEP